MTGRRPPKPRASVTTQDAADTGIGVDDIDPFDVADAPAGLDAADREVDVEAPELPFDDLDDPQLEDLDDPESDVDDRDDADVHEDAAAVLGEGLDLDDDVFASERRPRRRRRPSRTDLAVVGIIAANLLYRWLISRPGYFWQDDYFMMSWAKANGLTRDYLFLPASDHFQPLGLALLWVAQHVSPGSYDLAFAWTAVLYGASLWFLYRFLLVTFGWRVQFYLVLMFAGFSVFTLQAYLWYAASVWMAPLVCFSFLTLWLAARYRRQPSRRALVLVLLSMTAAVLSHPFAAAVPVLVLVLTACVPTATDPRTGWRALVRTWRLWPVLILPFALIPWFYLRGQATVTPRVFSAPTAASFVGHEWLTGVAPGVAGGPWDYDAWLGPEWAVVTPYSVFWVVQLVLLVLVVVPLLRRRTLSMWVAAALVVSAELGAVAVGRTFGGSVPLVIRYISPAVVPLAVAVACTMAVAPGDYRGWRARAVPLTTWWRGLSPVARTLLVLLLVQAYALSFSLTVVAPVLHNPRNDIRAYVEPRVASAQALGPDAELIPQFVPSFVIGEWAAPEPPTTQVVVGISPHTPRWVSSTTGPLRGFAPDGAIVDEFVYGARAKPGPNGACGYAVMGAAQRIPLQVFTTYGSSTVNLGVLSQGEHPVTVDLMRQGTVVKSIDVVVPAGLKRLFFPLIGFGDALRITPRDGGRFCVTDLVIGERAHRSPQGAIVFDAPSEPAVDYRLPAGGS